MADHTSPLSFTASSITTAVSSSSSSTIPLFGSIERMLSPEAQEDAAAAVPNLMSETELVAGVWTTRLAGIISLISSICMVWRAWNRREGLFHRLVFGMGIHLTIFGTAYAIGPAAVPKHATDAVGAHGTIATCTAQGFLIYMAFMTACSYYASFSVYSYLGTLNNFQKSAAFWVHVEGCIHVLVHVYPICSGIYLVAKNNFNNSGFGYCFLEADPIGCGDNVPCNRGTDSYFLALFWDVFLYLEMMVPTVIMIALYYKVKASQSKILIEASTVSKQAMIYLLALYAGVFPSTLVHTVEWFAPLEMHQKVILHLSSEIMFMLFGLLSMLIYLYFSTERSVVCNDDDYDDDDDDDYDDDDNPIRNSRHNCCDEDETLTRFMPRMNSTSNMIFSDLDKPSDEKTETEQNKGEGPKQEDTAPAPATTKTTTFSAMNNDSSNGRRSTSRRKSKSQKKQRYSFNIFDGTNASGNFAEFIFDGDSDDERNDIHETEKWDALQQHI